MKRLHIFLGAFFLPLVLVYIFTGFMFLTGHRSRGQLEETVIEAVWPTDRAGQWVLAENLLAARGFTKRPPDRVKSDTKFFFWGHSGAFSLALEPASTPGRVKVKIYEPTLYSRLMSLHANRARGGPFQGLAVIFSLGWLLTYFSLIFRKSKGRASWRWVSLGAGLLATAIVCLMATGT